MVLVGDWYLVGRLGCWGGRGWLLGFRVLGRLFYFGSFVYIFVFIG